MAQILTLLGLVLKFLPYIAPVLKGVFGALNNLNQATKPNDPNTVTIDTKKLQAFIEKRTNAAIKNIVEEHQAELVAYVPTEDQAKRDKKINDLLKVLEDAQTQYEKEHPTPPKPDAPSNNNPGQ